VQQLQRPAVGGRIELEVQRPDMIRAFRSQPHSRDRRVTDPEAFPLALRHPQALFAPQPLDLLAVDRLDD
jgi:hypothetical protein